MKADAAMQLPTGGSAKQDPHRSLHSADGALPGEHPGRSRNPLIKVAGLAWLEFEKPDLEAAERFLADFGFTVADRMPDTLILRGRQADGAVPGCAPRHAAPVYRSRLPGRCPRRPGPAGPRHRRDGHRALGRPRRRPARPQRDPGAGGARRSRTCPRCPERPPLPLNFGPAPVRVNATQRPVRRAAEIERLGHVVLGTTRFRAALDWYLDTLGLIVSDFLYLDGQRERGPVMAFIRCDQGSCAD